MVMRQSGDNRFGFSSYVVGEVLGDGCNYAAGSGIQTAIDDAFAAGGGVVLIRPSTVPYVVNLTFRNGVDLFGASVDGRLPFGLGQVEIQGNHTFTGTGGFEVSIVTNIGFSTLVGDLFTLNDPVGGAAVILAMQDCGLEANADPASRAIVLNAAAGASAQYATDNCNINTAFHCFEAIGAGNHSVNVSFGQSNSSTGNVFEMGSGSCGFGANSTALGSGDHIINYGVAGGNSSFVYCEMFSSNETFFHVGVSGPSSVYHSNISSSAASGFFVDGVAGSTILYDDIVLNGSAISISPTITETIFDWKPYATTFPSAAQPGAIRGTSSFDSAFFTVTNGWVTFTGTPITVPWVDQPISTTVPSNQGNFATGAPITLTLPPAPVQGDVAYFKMTIAPQALTVAANAGQTLFLGNQAGTLALSTQQGDCLELHYQAALATWFSDAIVGIWQVL